MNIVEAILIDRKKYNILISGFTWWWYFDEIIKTLSSNLGFDVIYNTYTTNNKLITSSDHLNFMKLNDDVKSLLDRNKNSGKFNGIIIVSPTFPPEKIEIPVDLHININTDMALLSTITSDYIKEHNITRMVMDTHLSYLSKSWKSNKISKFIKYGANYLETQDASYELLFETIMDNIMKKVYGEKYDEIKNNVVNPDAKKLINFSDEKEPSLVDLAKINTANNYGNFVKEAEEIISFESTDPITSEINYEDQLTTDPFDSEESRNELENIDAAGKAKYIGRRILHKM